MPTVAAAILVISLLWRLVFPAPQGRELPPAPVDPVSAAAVTQLENRLQRFPEDPNLYAQLGLSLLQQVRETGDTGLYARADEALKRALELEPNNLDGLIGRGMLATALHEFDDAIVWAQKARSINPWRAEILGILVDSYVELGLYEEAVAATQQMVDLRPGLESYSRVSYIRELHGDVEGATQAMRAAVAAGVPGTEPFLWAQIQLGNLQLLQGDLASAEQHYLTVLDFRPSYVYGKAGLAHVEAKRGNLEAAVALLEEVVAQLPLPEFVTKLGNLYAALGNRELAQGQWDLVRVMQRLNEDAGMNIDRELAAFEVEYGSNAREGLRLALAAYEARPTIFAADTLAWALFKSGALEEASRYSQEALRLGTEDPLILCHAEAIARAQRDLASGQYSEPRASCRFPLAG